MAPFEPLLRSPHLQTLAGHLWRRPEGEAEFPVQRRLYRTEPDVQVLVCLTSDLLAVLRESRKEDRAPAFLVGFSLGGNVVLKLAGEMGESARDFVQGVCTVSAPLDLAACARRIGERDNRLYEARFVRAMRRRLAATGRYRRREFAPSFGFGDAANYYRTQSAIAFLAGLRVPALLVQAKDDTFVPFGIYESAAVRSNPWIQVMATDHGGHLGFIGRRPNRFWSDEVIMEWIAGVTVKKPRFESSKV
jgi:predicted alpha/beta-fold hydrolase